MLQPQERQLFQLYVKRSVIQLENPLIRETQFKSVSRTLYQRFHLNIQKEKATMATVTLKSKKGNVDNSHAHYVLWFQPPSGFSRISFYRV